MPAHFNQLAIYNSEVARGLVHAREWKGHMAVLQMEFNAWRDEQAGLAGTVVIGENP